MLTCCCEGALDGSGVGGFQSPDHELKAVERQPVLPAVQLMQPRLVLPIQIILHESRVGVTSAACVLTSQRD